MSGNDGLESWVEDLAELDAGESDESDIDAEYGDAADDAEDLDDVGADAEGRARRRRYRRPRRRILHARARNYGRGVKGVATGLVRTPSGDARIALQQPVPSLRDFRQTVSQIQDGMMKNSEGIKQLELQQRQDVASFDARFMELKRDIVRTRKHAALMGVASALAPVVVRLVQQQTEPDPAAATTVLKK
jgi:hypothetical protein